MPKTFHEFIKLADTRWLARYNVVKVILDDYFELKSFFATIVKTEKCYTARQLNTMLNDISNYLYLRIVKPILFELNDINMAFQGENINMSCADDDLVNLITFLAKKILKPSFISNLDQIVEALENDEAYMHVNEADFGIEYKLSLLENKDLVNDEIQNDIECRAFSYIKKLCLQLTKK